MKKLLFITIIFLLSIANVNAQTSKWGISYTGELAKEEISVGSDTAEASGLISNINIHYSLLSWASPFQIGPLVSYRFASGFDYEVNGQTVNLSDIDDSISDLQIGLNVGYNFSEKIAIVMDTYKILDSGSDDLGIIVVKPALEISIANQISGQLGFTKYLYSGSDADLLNYKGSGLLFGLKYKF